MRPRAQRPWPTYLLAALCLGAIVAAVLVVGPSSGTASATGRTITVGEGVVQSTVSGSGNIQAATQLDLGFKTSGVVTEIYVHQGQHVTEGQLLAELNPDSAEVTLEQARASLQAAEANLVQEEETDGEGSSGSGSSDTGASHTTASAASVEDVLQPSNQSDDHRANDRARDDDHHTHAHGDHLHAEHHHAEQHHDNRHSGHDHHSPGRRPPHHHPISSRARQSTLTRNRLGIRQRQLLHERQPRIRRELHRQSHAQRRRPRSQHRLRPRRRQERPPYGAERRGGAVRYEAPRPHHRHDRLALG